MSVVVKQKVVDRRFVASQSAQACAVMLNATGLMAVHDHGMVGCRSGRSLACQGFDRHISDSAAAAAKAELICNECCLMSQVNSACKHPQHDAQAGADPLQCPHSYAGSLYPHQVSNMCLKFWACTLEAAAWARWEACPTLGP